MTSTQLTASAALLLCAAAIGCGEKQPARGGEGEPCSKERPCREGLACEWITDRCRTPAYLAHQKQRYAERVRTRREALRRQELALLKQSGVEQPAVAGELAEAPDPSAHVAGRVAHTTGKGNLFAACRPDERLVSGGCRAITSSTSIKGSYPAGSRWVCEFESKYFDPGTEAYAICQHSPAPRDARAR